MLSYRHDGEKGFTMNKFYAIYQNSNTVLVFDSASERDEFVYHESLVYPECIGVSEAEIHDLIEGKEPVYDEDFDCLVIRS